MSREDIIKLAREAEIDLKNRSEELLFEAAYAAGAAAERKVVMDSLQKQADLAVDEFDRKWALEMKAAIRARSNT